MKISNVTTFSNLLNQRGAPSEFLPYIYLLLSKEGRDNQLGKKLLREKFRREFAGDLAEFFFDSTLTLSKFNEEAASPHFLVRKRLFYISEAEKLSKEVWQSLLSESWGPDLFFVLEGAAASNPHYKECEKQGVVFDLSLEKSWEREKQLKALAEALLAKEGKSIEPKALQLLVARGEIDYQELTSEIEKLIVATLHKKTIQAQDLLDIIPYRRSLTPYILSEAIFDKNRPLAFREMRLRLDAEDPFLLMLKQLRTQFQTMMKVAAILESGKDKSAVTEHFPYMRGQVLERQIAVLAHWSYRELFQAYLSFDELEMYAKNGVTDDRLLADLLLAKILQ